MNSNRALPVDMLTIPHHNNEGGIITNAMQTRSVSMIYADATEALLGNDARQSAQQNGFITQQDPWAIIQRMSEDNRMLIEQVSRLTMQLTHLQSMIHQQYATTQLAAIPSTPSKQGSAVKSTLNVEVSGPKRVLSPVDEDRRDSYEMDRDPDTRTVNSAQKRRRAAGGSPTSTNMTWNTNVPYQNLQQRTILDRRENVQPHRMVGNSCSEDQRVGAGSGHEAYSNSMANDESATRNLSVTVEARRYAQSRYPFSPFIIETDQNIRDKIIVESMCKYAKDNHNFNLEIAGYRRAGENGASGRYRTLVFVKDIDTFAFLLDQKVWPQQIGGSKITCKLPSTPPQLAAVLPDVPMNVNIDELSEEIRAACPNVTAVVRLRNRYQREIKAVKIELNSVAARKNMLDKKRVYCLGLSLEIVEYLAQAHVLICSQCMGIGHFRKNCPQKSESTCNVCGTKGTDMQAHKIVCSGQMKCVHCGNAHKSNDTKCPVIKDFRAALTRTLLTDQRQQQAGATEPHRGEMTNYPRLPPSQGTHVSKRAHDGDKRWSSMTEEFASLRADMYAMMNVLCELVKNYDPSNADASKADGAPKKDEAIKIIEILSNKLQPHLPQPS